MDLKLNRRQAIGAISAIAAAPLSLTAAGVRAADDDRLAAGIRYELQYTFNQGELVGDLEHGERGDPHRESDIPHGEWYSHETRKRFGAWGPEQRRYAPLEDPPKRPTFWKRQRVIAVAERFFGYEYQHHHIPDWDPPRDWPWKQCCAGRNGRGVDCSNFTSFVYNQGFGIKMSSGIEQQSELHTALDGPNERISVRRIDLPVGFFERRKALQTGDLVYIRGREDGPVTHVVLWVGDLCYSPSGDPMIIDSHGGNVDDDWGRPIRCGIHLRPFRENSWYNRCASHAHRVFV